MKGGALSFGPDLMAAARTLHNGKRNLVAERWDCAQNGQDLGFAET
jgi:hypothetical protein